MSGGHFNYQQYRIRDIADSVDDYVNGHELYEDDLESLEQEYQRGWIDKEEWNYIKEHHHTKPNERNYPKEVIEKFKEGYRILRLAEIYAQRIDWLLSDDDSEDSFLERLKEDIDEFNKDNNV